jgi:hypothetical protein
MSNQREVPQFINIEDKIAFQLTAKQLGWIGVGCFFGFLAWVFLEEFYFVISTIIIGALVLVILFIRPYGQTIPEFIGNAITFMFKPKVYIWKKGYQKINNEEKVEFKITKNQGKTKKIDSRELKKAIEKLDIYE